MSVDILMPALSPTMEEGTLAKWLKKEGDAIKSGDIIAEIETDKATMEVEAVDEGVLAKILVPEGTEGVKVNAVIAVLAGDDEEVSSAKSQAAPATAPAEKVSEASAPRAEAPVARVLHDPSLPEGVTFTETTVRDALRDAMAEEMRRDERVFVMGEEVAQ